MKLLGGLLWISTAMGQAQAPIGLVHGQLLERETAGMTGELSVRSTGNQVFRFVYDGKTYFEREKERISATGLRTGDQLEIVADQSPESSLRYARTVHVMEPQRPLRAAATSLGRFRAYRSPLEHIAPSGDLTFSGVVRRLNDAHLVLRMREGGEKILLLREDTRYVQEGSEVEWSTLHPNTRVFIRAGRNLDNELEAYQVVWGEILEPGISH